PVAFGQVVSGTAGARPLVNSSSPKAVKRLARDHEVELDPGSGLISILGGKWTTYRAMAEDTIDSVQKVLKKPAKACRTKCYPLLGSIDYTPEYWRSLVNQFRISENAARYLARKYGTRASDVMNLATNDRELALPLVEGLAPLRAQVVFGIRNEMAISIEDILARRIGLELYGWKETIEAAPVVAKLLARELGWPETVRREAVDEYTNKIRSRMQKAGLAPVPAGT
ncbi:MAG: glycerol-3-phosphate dehydrogenase C-terminal domain-containing protein, partial [Candidatus Acidiferrales bacterium]